MPFPCVTYNWNFVFCTSFSAKNLRREWNISSVRELKFGGHKKWANFEVRKEHHDPKTSLKCQGSPRTKGLWIITSRKKPRRPWRNPSEGASDPLSEEKSQSYIPYLEDHPTQEVLSNLLHLSWKGARTPIEKGNLQSPCSFYH